MGDDSISALQRHGRHAALGGGEVLLLVDRIETDRLESEFGVACAQRYWTIFDSLREELGYVDYLGALQRYRVDIERDFTIQHIGELADVDLTLLINRLPDEAGSDVHPRVAQSALPNRRRPSVTP